MVRLSPFFHECGYVGEDILLSLWDSFRELFNPNTVDAELKKHKAEQERDLRREQERADRRAEAPAPTSKGYLTLGTIQTSDRFPASSGIENRKGWLRFKEELLDTHLFVLGTTGAGKTTTLTRICEEILQNTDRNLYVIDGKGDLSWAYELATRAYHNGRGQVPIFKMGHGENDGAIYDGFRGSRDAIYNRLAAMIGVREAEGNAVHFAYTYQNLLQLVCGVGHEKLHIEPPRSFQEVIERLSEGWLTSQYKNYPAEMAIIQMAHKGRDSHLTNLVMRLATFARSFGRMVSPSGFSLENSRVALFSLRTQTAGIDSRHFLNFFVEDVKDWIGKRQTQKGVLVIDEFGTFGNENITDVLSLARSSNLGVILATQSVATLGDELVAQKILDLTNIHILMKTIDPERMVKLAGTRQRPEASLQHKDNELTSLGSVRFQDQFAINPNKVAQLDKGEAFVLHSRMNARIQVVRLPEIAIAPEAIASFTQPQPKDPISKTGDNSDRPFIPIPD